MITADKINFETLKAVVKELNELNLLTEKIKTIGVGKEVLAKKFVDEVYNLSEEAQGKLTENIINYCNELIGDEAEGSSSDDSSISTEEEKPKKEEKPPKEEKPKKEEKPPKESKPPKEPKERKPRTDVPTDKFGCKIGSQAEKIDTALIEGGKTLEEMATICESNTARVKSHIMYLKGKGHVIESKEGKYYYREDGKLQFPVEEKPKKEEKPVKNDKSPKEEKPKKEEKPPKEEKPTT